MSTGNHGDSAEQATDEKMDLRHDHITTEAEEDESPVQILSSLCMNCQEDGETKLLLYHIPYFREILISSFDCQHCGEHNTSIQSAGKIQEKGAKYTLKVEDKKDLERQVVRNDTATVRLEEIDVELPTGQSELTNIEGILLKIVTELEVDQPLRKAQNVDVAEKLQTVIDKLKTYMDTTGLPFTISIDDPTGNSFIEPFPARSSAYEHKDYLRSPEQNEALGMGGDIGQPADPEVDGIADDLEDLDIVDGKTYALPQTCPACSKPCTMKMQRVNIPHFKEVYIMAVHCDHCGYRTSDVKTGGEVPEYGRRISLKVENALDLSRDLLKSETCALTCPELELEVHPGTLGGRFTTVEGLLTQVRDQLHGQVYDVEENGEGVLGGDSMTSNKKQYWEAFFKKLESAISAKLPFTVILEDPLANSYVQSLSDEVVDPQIELEDYERTEEEKEWLGLNDMVTEGYEQDEEIDQADKAEGLDHLKHADKTTGSPAEPAGVENSKVEAVERKWNMTLLDSIRGTFPNPGQVMGADSTNQFGNDGHELH